jgi:phospholipid/cholesterol/gamma-HCH transport system substrate-binding protein
MTPYRRNIMVGLTMLGALVILAWMIIQFGDRPAKLFAPETMPITLVTERADGIAQGSSVTYRGVPVGRVATVNLAGDEEHVNIEANVEKLQPPLPANLEGVIHAQVFGGSGQLSLQLTGPKPQGQLKPEAKLPARYAGLGLLPPEFKDLATELRLTAKQFRESNIVGHLDQQVEKAGQILDSVNKIISDPQLRENVKVAVANIREASGRAADLAQQLQQTTKHVDTTVVNTNQHIDVISRQLNDRMEQIGKMLGHLESITAKIDQGKGTAGALVNNPQLYQSMQDTAVQLNQTIKDLKRLVEQWEQEGISFKLK